jgi:hypothetical protein
LKSDFEGDPSGDFYFQAFNGAVSLPVAGRNYNSDWTPLFAVILPLKSGPTRTMSFDMKEDRDAEEEAQA